MSSSLPLTFTHLHYPHHKPSSYLKLNLFSPSKFTPKPHICFTFNKNSSGYEREEQRWLREEQRWLREEQRWLREQERWEDEKEVLLNEIQNLKNEIESLRSGGVGNGNVENVVKLLNVLKKEVSQISESGSSGVPFVVEANAEDVEHVEVVKEAVEEVEVKEVEVKEVKEVKVNVDKKRMTMLRVGSEGDQVQMLQEALLKLGFYCGEEDEEFSSFASGTERAVKTWQSSIGVPETGVMTVELLERLFVESGFKEIANGAAATSVTEVPEIPQDPKAYVSDDRVFLLGENRYEDSSRLKNRNSQTQTSSKGVVTTKCITCRGEGRLLCLECDGTGEPNIEPQFLEWVGEDTKCPYCEGHGHINCDACQGTGVGAA